jgi:hypothetical protein
MTSDEATAVLDEFLIRPGGHHELCLSLDEDGALVLSHLTFDSRDDRYFEEYPPEVFPASQEFSRSVDLTHMTEPDLVRECLQLIAVAMAHEALEWTRYKGTMIHDPHVEGEPVVML